MQNDIIHYNGKPVRIIERQSQLWFLATDICRALDIYKLPTGYVSTTKATYSLKYNEEKCVFVGALSNAHQKLTFVNEQGLHKMVANSGKHLIDDLQNWIKLAVLPTLQRPASSIAPSQEPLPQLTDDEIILKAITILQSRLKQATDKQNGQEPTIVPITPKSSKQEPQWLTVNEWCKKNKISLDCGERFNLGRKAAVICKREGIEYEKKTAQYWKAKGRTYKSIVKIYPEHTIKKAAEILGIEADAIDAIDALSELNAYLDATLDAAE